MDRSIDRSIDRAPFYEMSGPSPETTELPRADKEHEQAAPVWPSASELAQKRFYWLEGKNTSGCQ